MHPVKALSRLPLNSGIQLRLYGGFCRPYCVDAIRHLKLYLQLISRNIKPTGRARKIISSYGGCAIHHTTFACNFLKTTYGDPCPFKRAYAEFSLCSGEETTCTKQGHALLILSPKARILLHAFCESYLQFPQAFIYCSVFFSIWFSIIAYIPV